MFIELTPEGHEEKCLLNVEHIETSVIEVWTDAGKGIDRMDELQKKNREDGFAYQITAVEVKG